VEIKKLNPKILWSTRRGVKTILHRRKQRKTKKIEQKEAKVTKVRRTWAELKATVAFRALDSWHLG
jgi:hypothetical protein